MVQPARGDNRFKDDAWQETPYYDLLKQSYLLASKQLSEFVDHAQVDEKTKLKLRFHARQFIDAMSSVEFPCDEPRSHPHGDPNPLCEPFGGDQEPD